MKENLEEEVKGGFPFSLKFMLGAAIAFTIYAGCYRMTQDPAFYPVSGKITKKIEEAERDYYANRCEGSMPSVRTSEKVFDDEDHILVFEKEDFWKFDERRVYVSKETFDSFELGDGIDLSKIKYEDDDKCNKKKRR